MKKEEYTVIEIFNKKGRQADEVLKDIFKLYVTKQINSQKDLNKNK